jgi:hypothetical protein
MTTAPLISRLFIYTAVGAVIAGAAMPHHASAASFYLQDRSVKGLARAYSGEVADQARRVCGGIRAPSPEAKTSSTSARTRS